MIILKQNNNIFKILLIFILVSSFFLFLSNFVFAQFGLEETVSGTQIAQNTPAEFVGIIVRYVLGILGVVLVALIIYGGVVYATSAGNEERTKTAKDVLTYAIIGIFIIALAFPLSSYVLTTLTSRDETSIGGDKTLTNQGNPSVNIVPYSERYGRGEKYCGKGGDKCSFPLGSCCAGYICSDRWSAKFSGKCELPLKTSPLK